MFEYILFIISVLLCGYIFYDVYNGCKNSIMIVIYFIHIVLTVLLFTSIILVRWL